MAFKDITLGASMLEKLNNWLLKMHRNYLMRKIIV